MEDQNSTKNYGINLRDFSEQDRDFWNAKYQISRDILIKYKVTPITFFKRDEKIIIPPGLAYAYDIKEGYKIYQPLNPKYKFQYIGKKGEKFIFGYDQLPLEGDFLIITGGEKDVLTLASKGFFAITLNSETATFPIALYEHLQKRFRKIVILYDNDATGLSRSKALSEQFNLERIILPTMKIGKDVSDYVSLGYSLETLFRMQLPLIFKDRFIVSSFSDLAINANSLPAIRKIWGCYVLENSLTIFPSERGIGKTYLMLQLAIKVAGDDNSFCNEVIEHHGDVLYINLELSDATMGKRIQKLNESQSSKSKYKAHIVKFDGNLIANLENIIKTIKELKPILVIIDNLRAAGSHIDNEKNKAVVGFIQSLQKIITEYNCAIILVHHTKKGTRNQYLNSDMQSGAGALTDLADADFLMGRSCQDKDYRLVKRLKSRNCGEQEKPKLLRLNPDTLWYECIEEEVNESDHIIIESKRADKEKETNEWRKLRLGGKTQDEIAKIYNVNKSTVSRRLKE